MTMLDQHFGFTGLTEVRFQTKWNGLVVVMDLLGILREDTNASGLGSATIAADTKYHVVFTRSGSSGLKGYVNKTLDWSDSNTASHYASGDYEINIGNWFNYLSNYG